MTDWLALGAGFLALAELSGGIDVAPNDEGRIGSRVRDEVIADYSLVGGALVRPMPWLAFALVYHGESNAGFELPITAELGSGFSIPIPVLTLVGGAQYDPRQVSFETSVRFYEPRVIVGAGITWKQWSLFENPIVYTTMPESLPSDQCPLKVPDDHTAETGCPQPVPDFNDTFVGRVGVEWSVPAGDFTVSPRFGAAFEPSPAPAQKADHNYLDNDRIISAVGVGVQYEQVTVQLAGQWHHLLERTSTKDESLMANPEQNPGFPSVTHGGDIWFWGVELGMDLEVEP